MENPNYNAEPDNDQLASDTQSSALESNLQNKSPKNNKIILMIIILLIIIAIVGAILAFVLLSQKKSEPTNTTSQEQSSNSADFGNQKKSAHFESSTPAHGSTLAASPNQVVINFDFDLTQPSSISITSAGKEYGQGETVIDEDLTSMRKDMSLQAPSGVYEVKYKACWPDKSCHDGSFKFAIDSEIAKTYTDLRGQKTVTIEMKDIAFEPENIIIDKGTTVNWVNKEGVQHYVNTDSHPAHTHQLGFNSKALDNGDSYGFTFTKAGAFPYHCSAHAAQMTGNILVEE